MSEYKLVPVEPTSEMLAAGEYALEAGCYAGGIYADMLAAAPAVHGEPAAVVDADDDGMWADILPNVTVKVGQTLYAAPQPAEQQPAPDVAGLVKALEQVLYCTEVGFLPIIIKQSVSSALAAHRKGGGQ